MASKLTDITASYHSFVKDQVLTETQLNEFLDYFEDQDRLARISLSGVGIVCGFEPSVILVTDSGGNIQKQIRIKQGCGVTTDGDLLQLREKGSADPLKNINIPESVFSNYREFTDPNAQYLPFLNNGAQFKLWEAIRSTEVSNESAEPKLTSFVGLENMVVLLYLECFEDKNNLCNELSCDSQGTHQVARLRVLFTTETNATILLSKDQLFTKHDLMSVYTQMADLSVKRVVLPLLNLSQVSNQALAVTSAYQLSNNAGVINDLKAGLQLMANKLTPYFPAHGIGNIIAAINAKLPTAGASPSLFFQYRYDFLKDVVDTYNELKELFIQVASECCPDITAFPKHLLLGKLQPTDSDKLVGRYRHKFYRSPILLDGSSGFDLFRSVLSRLDEMMKAYPVLPETAGSTKLLRDTVKITPSAYRTTLGNKSIPFYYGVTLPLLKSWNFEKTRLGKQLRNLSYDTSLLDSSAPVQTPLRYNLESTGFLRIEGHQGRDYKEVMAKIDTIKKENGLSFDLKALCVDTDTNIVIDPSKYECEFEDLSVLLKAWVNEQQCGIGKATSLISSYSLSRPEYNTQEELYTGPIGVTFPAPVFTYESAAAVESLSLKTTTTASASSLEADKQLVLEDNKLYYEGEATVIDNLTLDEDTVGGAFLYALKNQPNGTPSDLAVAANYYADKFIEEEQIDWDPKIKVILVNNSFHLLAHLQALSNSIPVSIAGITDKVIADYGTNIQNLCSTLQKIQVTYTDSTTLSTKNRAILGLLINQLTSICCASQQLQALLTEIDTRKDAILERLTLKKFVEQHPGLEHFGGVEQGGTFVLVYLRKGVNVDGGVQNVPNGTVIADFALPYMCCSDCAPVNFIIAKDPVLLRLPKDTVCLGNTSEVLTFQVEPADGVIKADPSITGMSISGNQLTIDPLLFDKNKLNQVVKFTVNDQITSCQLVVKEPLTADFAVPNSPATNTLVHFSALGTFPAGTKFAWTFGDGTTSDLQTVDHNYQLPIANAVGNTVEVTLKVTPSDGSCPTIVTKSFSFAPLTIDITPKTFCNNDTANYTFVVTPTGATPTISGLGVNAANRTFSPLGVAPGAVPILLNGSQVLTLTVNTKPTVVMDGTIDSTMLQLTSNLVDGQSFKWVFEDASGSEVHAPIQGVANPQVPISELNKVKQGQAFVVSLIVESLCGLVTQKRSFVKPAVKVTIDLTPKTFCNNDKDQYAFTISPAGSQVTITGPGVDAATNSFSPFGLPTGSAVIALNGTTAMTLTISSPPSVSFTVSIQNDIMTLQSSLTDVTDVLWSFASNSGTKIHEDIEQEINPTIQMSSFSDIKPGDLINIKLYAKNQCGDGTDVQEIIYPSTESHQESCRADVLNDIKGFQENLQGMMSGSVFSKLSASEKSHFEALMEMLNTVNGNPLNYLNGSLNASVTRFYQAAFSAVKQLILENTDQEKRQLFYYLYKLHVASFYAILQCQDEGMIMDNKDILAILSGINSDTDPKNENGFWPLQLIMDQSPGLAEYLLTVMQYRPTESQSADLIKILVGNLSQTNG